MRNNKIPIKTIIILALLLSYFLFILIYNNLYKTDEEENWNQIDESPKYDSSSLYESSKVPDLNKLFINSNFITQVKVNRLSYLYGFSKDGNYLASIYYEDKIQKGYIINIDNISTAESVFSLFIPDNNFILESKEFIFAKELVEVAYEINIAPSKSDWNNIFIYETNQGIWYFDEESNEEYSEFNISTNTMEDNWSLVLNNQSQYPVYTEVFLSPENDNWLIFVLYFDQFQSGISKHKTIFIDLDKLTNKNSVKGIVLEADRWLYGDFDFIYNQWEECNRKGFIAVAVSENQNLEQEENPYDLVDQWTYLDTTGKMQWYGNSEGIYNSAGESIFQTSGGSFYKLSLIEHDNKGLVYYVIDIFSKADNSFIKTIEFVWDRENQYMVPIKY
ncbi:MAG: hypothetical protein AB7V16_03420 [Vulcanibacillus sp.]